MLNRAAKIGVHDERGVPGLGASKGQISDGSGFAFTWTATDHRERVCTLASTIKFNIGPQNPIGLCIRRIAKTFVQEIDVLRNNRQDWHPEQIFDVLHRFHARVEIFKEERESDADQESDQSAEGEIELDPRSGWVGWWFGNLLDADCNPRHRQLHCLALRARADFIKPLPQFIASGLRSLQVVFQCLAYTADLLFQLPDVDISSCAHCLYFGVVFAEAGTQKEGLLRNRILVAGQDFLERRVLNVEYGEHAHQIFAFKLLDLIQLAGKGRNLGLGVVDLRLLFHDDAVNRRLRVFRSFWIKIDNLFAVANPGHFRGRVINPLLLLGDFVVHCANGTVEDFLFLVDTFVLINSHDFVRDVGSFLRIGIVNTDLEKVRVPNLFDVKLAAQYLISHFAGKPKPALRPFILEL